MSEEIKNENIENTTAPVAEEPSPAANEASPVQEVPSDGHPAEAEIPAEEPAS